MKKLSTIVALTLSLICTASAFATSSPPAKSVYDFDVTRINGSKKPEKLSAYKGKVVLFVNVASQCGFTPQYKGLEATYEKYGKDGFVILGFPSNDFGAQEPGSAEEIKSFCERNYKVTFPLFEKAPVSGNRIQPLYAFLVENAPWKGAVGWNFEKFLVGRDGKIVGRYKSKVKPDDAELTSAIESALKAKP